MKQELVLLSDEVWERASWRSCSCWWTEGRTPPPRDPEFDAPPVEWARFLRQPHVVAWLEQHTG